GIGEGAVTGLDVAGVGIDGNPGDHRIQGGGGGTGDVDAGAGLIESVNAGSDVGRTVGVQDGAVAGGIGIEVGIDRTGYCEVLGGLISEDRSDLPVAQNVFVDPVLAVLVDRQII